MIKEKLRIPTTAGHTLSAELDLPETGSPGMVALFAHCFTCGKNLKFMLSLSRRLGEAGIAVLRFDFTGLGNSEGEFRDTNFSSNVSDILDVADFMASRNQAPGLLIGHSLGGAAMLHAAENINSAKCAAVIATPFNRDHVLQIFDHLRSDVAEKGEATFSLGGTVFTVNETFFEKSEFDTVKILQTLELPLLIIHSPEDKTVDIDHGRRLYDAMAGPKRLELLQGADHLLSNEVHIIKTADLISEWAGQHY